MSFLSQSRELHTRVEEVSSSVSTQWEGLSQVSSTYVIDCVRPEDQGIKYCRSFSKNMVQTMTTALLVNSKQDNDISPLNQTDIACGIV